MQTNAVTNDKRPFYISSKTPLNGIFSYDRAFKPLFVMGHEVQSIRIRTQDHSFDTEAFNNNQIGMP